MPAGDIVVRLLGDTRDLERKFGDAAGRIGKIGNALTSTLTPAAAAIAGAFALAFKEFDKGADALRAGTGKTGEALESLVQSAKNVSGTVTQGFGEIGEVMAELASRTNLTGRPLEDLTRQILNLARITGSDAKASVESITRLFGDWSVKTREQTGTLDQLLRVSQETGVPIQRLSELMVKFGAPLRQFNFGFQESALTLAKFEKEGVNTELVMGALRIALGKFSGEGEEAKQELEELTGKAASARDRLESLAEGVRTATQRLTDLRERVGDARERITDLQESLQEARKGVEDAFDDAREKVKRYADAVEEAKDRLGDLNDNVKTAKSRIGDLARELQEAKDALDEALGGASADEVEEASIAIEQARIRQRESANDTEDAERELSEAMASGDPEKIERASLRLESARLAEREAALALTKAEQDLTEVRQKGTEQDEEVIRARERVRKITEQTRDAERELADAQRAVTEGQADVARAQREYNEIRSRGLEQDEGVVAARRRVQDVTEQLSDAERDLARAVREVGDGHRDLADAQAALGAGQTELAKVMDSIERLNSLRTDDVEGALQRTFDAIKNAGSAAEANAIAIEVFGRRAGPDMAAAIREGRFEIDDLKAAVAGNTDTIQKAADETEDWTEKLEKLKSTVVEQLGPIGQWGAAIAGAIAGIGPALNGLLLIFPSLAPKIATALGALFSGAGALTAVGTAIGAFAAFVLSKLDGAFGTVVRALIQINPAGRIIGFLATVFRDGWSGIFNDVSEFFGGILPRFFTQTIPRTFRPVTDFIGNLWVHFHNAWVAVWDTTSTLFRGIVNAIISAWNAIDLEIGPFKIPDWVPIFGGRVFHIPDLFPDISYLAKGGIVTGPTLAMIGEAGPEAVVPLDRARGGFGGGNTYHITVNVPPTANKAEVGAAMVEVIREYERRNGTSWRNSA